MVLNSSTHSLLRKFKKKKGSDDIKKTESKIEKKTDKKRPKHSHASLLDAMVNFTGATGAFATAAAFASREDAQRTSGTILTNKKSNFKDATETEALKCELNIIDCERCGKQLELYSEDTLGHLVLICSSIIQRECGLVAPYILDIILGVTR